MDATTRRLVRRRAGERCEYCLLRQEHVIISHHVEHVIARRHGGSDDPGNLAPACDRCNAHKGPNLSGIDPESGQLVRLFHPRSDVWADHFGIEGSSIVGRSPSGRATVLVLSINHDARIDLRTVLIAKGRFP